MKKKQLLSKRNLVIFGLVAVVIITILLSSQFALFQPAQKNLQFDHFNGIKSGYYPDWLKEQGIQFSSTSKILDYEIEFTRLSGAYYTPSSLKPQSRCVANYKIYKDGELVQEIKNVIKRQRVELDDVTITLFDQSVYHSRACRWISNNAKIKIPQDAFDFVIDVPERAFFVGENATIVIYVENKWRSINGTLNINFEIPTLVGFVNQSVERQLDNIPIGRSKHEFKVSTAEPVNIVQVTPYLDLELSTNELENMHTSICGTDGKVRPVATACGDSVNIGTFVGDSFNITVAQKPQEIVELPEELQQELDVKIEKVKNEDPILLPDEEVMTPSLKQPWYAKILNWIKNIFK